MVIYQDQYGVNWCLLTVCAGMYEEIAVIQCLSDMQTRALKYSTLVSRYVKIEDEAIHDDYRSVVLHKKTTILHFKVTNKITLKYASDLKDRIANIPHVLSVTKPLGTDSCLSGFAVEVEYSDSYYSLITEIRKQVDRHIKRGNYVQH